MTIPVAKYLFFNIWVFCSRPQKNVPAGEMKRPCIAIYFICLFILASLAACHQDEPIRIGYVGGLTGRTAGLGMDGRDGARLAVDTINQAGGIGGRRLQLLIRDDKQEATTAKSVVSDLLSQRVTAIIGHTTSSMSVQTVDLINTSKTVMISPTAATHILSNQDDYFFRVYPSTAVSAQLLADFIFTKQGHDEILVVYDTGNAAYSESYLEQLSERVQMHGGKVEAIPFSSATNVHFLKMATAIAEKEPKSLVILASAMDTAMICQQLAKIHVQPDIVSGEWAATRELLESGGQAVNGIHFFHTFDTSSVNPAYLDFKKRFIEAFGHEPGFAAVHAYDSVQVLLAALTQDPDPSNIKRTITKIKDFEGLQGNFSIDGNGDATYHHFLMTIENNQFRRMED